MSYAISARTVGKHSSANAELRARRAESDNRRLIAAVEDREKEIHTALVRGCQDSMRIARLKEQAGRNGGRDPQDAARPDPRPG